MEMLIVVAIIGVLVAVAIPMFGSHLEKSREAVDLANVRSAYAEVLAASMLGQTQTVKVVQLKQQQNDWQSLNPVNIGGITHYKNQEDTDNWKGIPTAGGECEVSYNESLGVCLNWRGGGSQPVGPSIAFTEDVHKKVKDTGLLTKHPTTNFEIDSKCPTSTMLPQVQALLDKDSLLNHGTWAYLADTKTESKQCAYLFWTSVDTRVVGAEQKIPVIVSKNVGEGKEGGYYISETKTAWRDNKNGDNYVAIADHIYNYSGFSKYTKGTEYKTLEEAYEAYEELLNEKYPQYQDTLPK
mgnify:CR=1 FL=1